MSRRHPLRRQEPLFQNLPLGSKLSGRARVTCRRQTAGIFVKRDLLLLLGDPAGLLRSLLHCALRLLCLLSFLRHIALLMRWLNRCVHSGIEIHSIPNTPTLKKNSVPLKEVFTRERRSIRRFFENGTRNFSDR